MAAAAIFEEERTAMAAAVVLLLSGRDRSWNGSPDRNEVAVGVMVDITGARPEFRSLVIDGGASSWLSSETKKRWECSASSWPISGHRRRLAAVAGLRRPITRRRRNQRA